jgi:tRNA1Val (adenine37-N6)-methyltransferase
MGNPYFKFKQFTIRQDRCAMKVSTDACVFGAWLAAQRLPVTHTLDIGCGTGLLMAMLAQQWEGRFTGIDIDGEASLQATENLASTPWTDRLDVVAGDARSYPFSQSFDCIVSNPPFFERHWESDDHRLNLARHSSRLSLAELMGTIGRNLQPGGHAGILLPYDRAADCSAQAIRQGLWLQRRMDLRQTPGHGFFRSCMLFRDGASVDAAIDSLTIQDGTGRYTPEAADLLRPYYLYL